MYVNDSLESVVKDCLNGNNNESNRAVNYFIREYYNQRLEPNKNPFSIPIIYDMYGTPEEYSELLDRIYSWGIREFIVSNSSTALLEFLACILSDKKYSANIFKSTYFFDKFKTKRYCLFIEIKRRRSNNNKILKANVF